MAKNDKGKSRGDYDVGYCKPPKSGQFQPGQSGNPKGPKKGKRGLKTVLAEQLDAKMTIAINGQHVTSDRQSLMIHTLTAKAAAGDHRASQMVIDLVMQIFGPEDRGNKRQRLSDQDQHILDELLLEYGDEPHDDTAKAVGGVDEP